jgi:alpha-amylase
MLCGLRFGRILSSSRQRTTRPRLLGPVAVAALLVLGCSPAGSAPGDPEEIAAADARELLSASVTSDAGNGSIVFLRRWRWQDIMNHTGRVRDAGFTAVLVSPHTSTCGGPGSEGYDPRDFTDLNSGFGSESDLYWLVKTVHWFGLQIYADMVMNHMCATSDYAYPRFSWSDFHHGGAIDNWNDPWTLENKDLWGLNDLAQESPYVRSELFAFLVRTNDLGFDGYRWDAAKHVPIWFWRDHILGNVSRWGKYSFGEVLSGNLSTLQQYVDAGMSVTDYNLYFALQRAFTVGGDLRLLDGAGYAAVDSRHALTFVENNDVGAPPNRLLAYAFIAAYPGYPLFSDAALDDDALKNLVWIHNHKATGLVLTRWKEKDVLLFERAGNLLAGFNQSGASVSRRVATSFVNTRLHDYAGHVDDVWTDGAGRVEVWIPPVSYVMLAP